MQLLGLLPVTRVLCSVTEPSGAPNGEVFAIPPPATDAVFPVTSPLLIVSAGSGGVAPGTPCRLMFAMPAPMAALLTVAETLLRLAFAWLRRPTRVPQSALLPVNRVLFIC